jgi:hypothetical protein
MIVERLGRQWMFLMVEGLTTIDEPQTFPSFSHSFLG